MQAITLDNLARVYEQKKKMRSNIINEDYKYITCEEYAQIINLHVKTVRRLVKEGKIPGVVRIGREFRIPVRKGNGSYETDTMQQNT